MKSFGKRTNRLRWMWDSRTSSLLSFKLLALQWANVYERRWEIINALLWWWEANGRRVWDLECKVFSVRWKGICSEHEQNQSQGVVLQVKASWDPHGGCLRRGNNREVVDGFRHDDYNWGADHLSGGGGPQRWWPCLQVSLNSVFFSVIFYILDVSCT